MKSFSNFTEAHQSSVSALEFLYLLCVFSAFALCFFMLRSGVSVSFVTIKYTAFSKAALREVERWLKRALQVCFLIKGAVCRTDYSSTASPHLHF